MSEHLLLQFREAAEIEPRLLTLESWAMAERHPLRSREWRRRWNLAVLRMLTLFIRNEQLSEFEADCLNYLRVVFGLAPVFEGAEV
jgi:hypothetical protein